MSRFKFVIDNLKDRRERAITGKYNCIPCPFPRFSTVFPGTEQGKYIIITANQKIGKSKLVDFMYVYEPLFFMMEHPELKVKIHYFTLEMTPEVKYVEFLSHLLYRLDGKIVAPKDLRSTDNRKPIDPEILELLDSPRYMKYRNKFEEIVHYISDTRNPTGINKYLYDYALSNGVYNKKEYTILDENGIETVQSKLDALNPYTANDPDIYNIVIIDNYANLLVESNLNKMQTIDKWSKSAIRLRDTFKYTIVGVQHQAQQQEGIENIKLNRMKPSSDGLADNKSTTKDANMVIGLYDPSKFGKRDYEGYDLTKLRKYGRFLEIIEDRDYGANGNICPLFFNGDVATFNELPRTQDVSAINNMYHYIDTLYQKRNTLFYIYTKTIKNGKLRNNFRKIGYWKKYFYKRIRP